jgi:hypothetical protein
MRYHQIINESKEFTLSPQSQRSGEKMVTVNVQKIDQSWAKDHEYYIGTNGTGGIRNRYGNFGEFMKTTSEAIQVSELNVDSSGQVTFTNGRHRFAYMRDQGAKVMPVAMNDESIENAKKFGYLE